MNFRPLFSNLRMERAAAEAQKLKDSAETLWVGSAPAEWRQAWLDSAPQAPVADEKEVDEVPEDELEPVEQQEATDEVDDNEGRTELDAIFEEGDDILSPSLRFENYML